MATVLQFPVKKELPKEVVERLHEIAELYVTLLDETINEIYVDVTDEEEHNELTELMLTALIEGVVEAVDNLNEP